MKTAHLVVLAAFFGSGAFGQTMPATAPIAATQPVAPAVTFAAKPLPLEAVRVTGGPLKHAQDLDADYLLKLDPDVLLARFRERAGMPMKAAPITTGWETGGRSLTGHFAGHYLSALSYMYAVTGDVRFKQRADYVVSEFAAIQAKQGDGYIGAVMGYAPTPPGQGRGPASTSPEPLPTPAATGPAATGPATTAAAAGGGRRGRGQPVMDGKLLFQQLAKGEIRSDAFGLNGMWSPWYIEHKIFAGLRDAYHYTGNRQALEVEIKFAAWAESIVANLSDDQIQHMLGTEFGGINETFVDLYADTGDQRWLKLAGKFDQKALIVPMSQGKDILGGMHGNTQIPKILGNLENYLYTGKQSDADATRFFWDAVVNHHSFATGGHGYDEYFGPADKLSAQVDGTGQRTGDLQTDETCNVYNMLKMSRTLFALQPEMRFADYEERALFNHMMASIDPNDGRMCYMVPIGQWVQHNYQEMFRSFTCCVGTGMEVHALHGDGIYYEAGNRLWVNLYVPSTAVWAAGGKAGGTGGGGDGVKVAMETTFPEGEAATLHVDPPMPRVLTISLRRPAWAGANVTVKVNGTEVAAGAPGEFIDVQRTWTAGDTVTLSLPKSLHAEGLPDNPQRVAFMWGPIVLAGDFGAEIPFPPGRRPTTHPAFISFARAGEPVASWLKPVEGKAHTFHAVATNGTDITFVPFYLLPAREYGVYFDLVPSATRPK